ncbi:hypothetical protein QCB52_14965, partial [Myroides odoratimimus]
FKGIVIIDEAYIDFS